VAIPPTMPATLLAGTSATGAAVVVGGTSATGAAVVPGTGAAPADFPPVPTGGPPQGQALRTEAPAWRRRSHRARRAERRSHSR
jgi:hypothetical protein